MKVNKEKAWTYLTEVEKQSIYLTTGQGLSGWQAGEILGITHYKYLELKARSETLFKLFTDYFNKHQTLIRPTSIIKPQFRDYIIACVEKRLDLPSAKRFAGEGKWSIKDIREKAILKGMETLKNSENEHDRDLHVLLQEFDRWNNFRILPTIIQATSPYKRKSNRQAKAYFKFLRNIHINTINKITRTKTYRGKEVAYIAMFDETFVSGYTLIPIKNSVENIKYFTLNKIYIFPSYEDAIVFANLVKREEIIFTAKDGLKFWKEYDEVIRGAINCNEINHTSKIKDFYDPDVPVIPPAKKIKK